MIAESSIEELRAELALVRRSRTEIRKQLETEEYSIDDRSAKMRRLRELRDEEYELMARIENATRGSSLVRLVPVDC